MATKAYQAYQTKVTPQSELIPGKNMVANSAGGYSFAVDDWKRLDRFLILGAEGGTYYINERQLVKENAGSVLKCAQTDGRRTVDRIAEISDAGRAPKNDPALFALAMCAGLGDDETKRYALKSLPRVARTGTHLFTFVEYVQQFRGWGRGLRNAIGDWYNSMDAKKLAYQAVKYQQRNGWSNADLLRLSHPIPQDEGHKNIYKWMVDGEYPVEGDIIWAFSQAQLAQDAKVIVGLIRDYHLPREAVPTQFLTEASVWEALLDEMPMTALIRNLATMTRVGVIAPLSVGTKKVVEQLSDAARLQKARVHPLQILVALKTYEQGHGEKSNATWSPVGKVVDALDGAFYASFKNIEPSGTRFLLALDVSGSMSLGTISGMPGITPAIGAAAMALVTEATEKENHVMGFSHQLVNIDITARMRLDSVIAKISAVSMGGTDCAIPMVWATQHKAQVDTFVVYTDSETWFGNIHPVQALQEYRQKMGIPARLVVVGMESNGFTIADPNDAGMLDVVGFDTATPALISDFSAGKL